MVIFPLAPDQTIAQMWSSGARGGRGEVARSLCELTRKNVPFEWDTRRRQAFEALKAQLCSAQVLATPTDQGDFVLDVDASTFGAWAMLHQNQEGVLRVISYACKKVILHDPPRAMCHRVRSQTVPAVCTGRKVLVRSLKWRGRRPARSW